MKKIVVIFSTCMIFAILLAGCGAVEPDYTKEQFETALKKGEQ